jgi:transposase InsO family protein
MSPSTPTPASVDAAPQAPFDPRREARAIPPPPPQPSSWLDPIDSRAPGQPIEGGSEDDEPLVIDEDDAPLSAAEAEAEAEAPEPAPESDPIDPVTGATPATIAGRRTGQSPARRRLVTPAEKVALQTTFTPEQRLLILDAWKRSGLPAGDFAPLVNLSKHTLYGWKNRFEQDGPAGLMERKRGGPRGSRLSEATKRAIIMMKETNPEWGIERIADMLARGPGLGASPNAIGAVLREWGCEIVERPTTPHRDHKRRFERERSNELWQTDLFTFILKRQNQRVYLVAFIDDHSRFVVSFGLHASQSTGLVLEIFRAGIASYGTPQEVLTDNGSQYVTWRGKSAFSHECEKRGIKHIVAKPRRPQTLGKAERFWGTLWRELLSTAVFTDLGDARTRIGLFIDHYNFHRTHQGIDGLAPADRFFGAAPAMLATLKARIAANALNLAREGAPKTPFYLAGNVNGQAVSVHADGDRLLMKTGNASPVEVTLATATTGAAPSASPLPLPQTPQGVPVTPWGAGADGPHPPGIAPIDALLALPSTRQSGGAP